MATLFLSNNIKLWLMLSCEMKIATFGSQNVGTFGVGARVSLLEPSRSQKKELAHEIARTPSEQTELIASRLEWAYLDNIQNSCLGSFIKMYFKEPYSNSVKL